MLHQSRRQHRQNHGPPGADFHLQYRRHHHRQSRRPDPAGMAHSHPNPSRPARCHVRLPSARAARARARHRRQALEAGVSARLVSLHRRADLGQSAAGGDGQPGRGPVARARQSPGGADARPRQRRGRRDRGGGVLRLHVFGRERANPAAGGDHGRRHSARAKTRPATAPRAPSIRGCLRCCGRSTRTR